MFKRIVTSALVASFAVVGLAPIASADNHGRDDRHRRSHWNGHHVQYRHWHGCSGRVFAVIDPDGDVIIVRSLREARRLAHFVKGSVQVVKSGTFC